MLQTDRDGTPIAHRRSGQGPTRRRLGRARWWLIGGAGAATILAGCSSSPSGSGTSATTPSGASATTCPLTGEPAPNGKVPDRPALAEKVDNYPTARPQSGLDAADIVYEEPVESKITRYVAVFQCSNSSSVGPIRSARALDVGILSQFGTPLLASVGGIDPVLSLINQSPVTELDLRYVPASVIQHPAGRVAPYDTYASTAALWGLKPNDKTPPQPVFRFSDTVPSGTPVSSVTIPFSSSSTPTWTYDATTKQFLRSYGSTPDTLADGKQNAAANVVVQYINVTYGPWLENSEGGLEVQANLVGRGTANVFRNGVEIKGYWRRSSEGSATQWIDDATGNEIPLQPGQTWVELVPSQINVTAVSAGPSSGT